MSSDAVLDENPEWTEDDFGRARPASELPPDILAQFPKSRLGQGARKTATKIQVAIRLSPDILEHYRAGGRGFQDRIEAALRKAAGLKS